MAEPPGGNGAAVSPPAGLPREVREQLAELELELSEGVEPGVQKESRNQTPAPSAAPAPSSSKYHRARSGGARDERYRSVNESQQGVVVGIWDCDLEPRI
ncbi:disco-interacting protein 2 homolog B-like [Sceloporus undulatus]|uniref:disco-interacting protein 2 homolog B-like n=1 Tax=Sceloporus undulatus TaxID=8520 RepID=UPI001C4B529D|nr:disco-interacting protein 2 homolog B-like [Sceloporus undulatus]